MVVASVWVVRLLPWVVPPEWLPPLLALAVRALATVVAQAPALLPPLVRPLRPLVVAVLA